MTWVCAAVFALALCAGPAAADGPSTIPGDQCEDPPIALEDYAAQFPGAPAEAVQQWYDVMLAERAAECAGPANPWAPPVGMYSDEELLGFLLSGHQAPAPGGGGGSPGEPAPVPLPPAGALLAVALGLLVRWRR